MASVRPGASVAAVKTAMLRAGCRALVVLVWAYVLAGCNAILGNEDPSDFHLFVDTDCAYSPNHTCGAFGDPVCE